MSSLQVNLLAEDPNVAFDPVPTKALNLFDIRIRDACLVGEVEAQFSLGNERSFLVNVVTKDFSERPIENVSGSMIIPEGPTT